MGANDNTSFWWIEDKNKGYTKISQQGYYNTKEWKQLRLVKLSEKPLCEMCLLENRNTPAILVDHIVPITEDNTELFFDYKNLQSLCDNCHRAKTKGFKSRISKLKEGAALKNELEQW